MPSHLFSKYICRIYGALKLFYFVQIIFQSNIIGIFVEIS